MRRTTRSAALGGLAALVVTMVTPMTSATADQGDTLKGGCGMYSEGGDSYTAQQQGLIYVSSASQEASGEPSGATVQCWIDVNGSRAAGTLISASGNGEQSGAVQITYRASDTDLVTLCQQVTFSDGSAWVGWDGVNPDCVAVNEAEVPPQVVVDTLATVLDEVDTLQPTVIDPTLCPILITIGNATGGGVLGVHIRPDGDVYVPAVTGTGENQIYDCPPYDGFNLLTVNGSFSSIVIRWLTPSG
jgi:hypothetical protein